MHNKILHMVIFNKMNRFINLAQFNVNDVEII